MEIVISGYKLNQEAQLQNKHYDLNTGIDHINMPSTGVHTPLAQQVSPSLGGSSIINQGLGSLPRPHEEGIPQEFKGSVPSPQECRRPWVKHQEFEGQLLDAHLFSLLFSQTPATQVPLFP